jgi:hypothetical protein
MNFTQGFQYYPTPSLMAGRMVSALNPSKRHTILEPSAGKGSLIDAIKSSFSHGIGRLSFAACEVSPDLRLILASKQIPLVGDDFLKADLKRYGYDGIIMNPPFANGIRHFLHAWDILADGGRIVCLLNAQPFKTGSARTRQEDLVMRIVEENNGTIEIIKGAFAQAENKTKVDVAMLVVDKPDAEPVNFDDLFSELKQEETSLIGGGLEGDGGHECGLIQHNALVALVARYNRSVEAYAEVHAAHQRMNFLLPVKLDDGIIKTPACFSSFVDNLRTKCWDYVFRETNLANYMTGKVKEEFEAFQRSQKCFEFTVENVKRLLENLVSNQAKIRQKTVEQVFDTFTRYYHENRCHFEGWKSNERWHANRKIVLPHMVEPSWSKGVNLSYRGSDMLDDIERAMCMMVGKPFEVISDLWRNSDKGRHCSSMQWALERNGRDITDIGKWHDSEFFRIRVYKKGTAHLEFKDEATWRMFNKVACQERNWIGEG